MLDKFHNSDSEHGIDLVAYIYGEMDDAARDRFETHLAGCDKCAFELGSYADARLSVIEWRRNDFEPLATPAMIIPESQPVATPASAPQRRSWTAWIESIYALPGLARAGFGLAAAAILIGVLYFAFVPKKSVDTGVSIADKTSVPTEPQKLEVAPVPEQTVAVKKAEYEPGLVSTAARRSAAPRSNARSQTASLRQTPVIRNYRRIGPLEAVTQKAQTVPRLNSFEVEEDTTLRLSDLFSQVDRKK